jgi:hypothetical protein
MTPAGRAKHTKAVTKHGGYLGGRERPEHYIWRAMIARCYNPNCKNWQYYGGRGVLVEYDWFDYEMYLKDTGLRPSPAHSLDRIDNNGHYVLGNVRWATRSQQQKNKTSTRRYEQDGRTMVLIEWARELGISLELARWRFKTKGTFQIGRAWKEVC